MLSLLRGSRDQFPIGANTCICTNIGSILSGYPCGYSYRAPRSRKVTGPDYYHRHLIAIVTRGRKIKTS